MNPGRFIDFTELGLIRNVKRTQITPYASDNAPITECAITAVSSRGRCNT